MSDWGQGAKNNNIGWGQGAANNNIGWGNSHKVSWAGQTEIVGTDGVAPINTVAPVISGTATIGQTLTSTTGTWTSDTGVTAYLYQWYRGATLITGATSSTYVLVLADVGFDITCQVAATDTDGTSAYVSSNQIFLFDVDYKAILDRGTALSYTLPTLAQQKLQNKLLMDMKADGVWAKLDVFYNFANNGGRDFARINWKNPSATVATLFNSITFNSNVGFQGNGTDMYIDTNFQLINGVNYTQNNASRYLWMNTASGTNPFDGNALGATNTIRRQNSTAQRINQGVTGVSPSFDYTAAAGMKSIHRTSLISITLFNGTTPETRTVASATLMATNHLILRSQSLYGSHTLSMYAVGASMVSENTNFINDYQSYLNSI